MLSRASPLLRTAAIVMGAFSTLGMTNAISVGVNEVSTKNVSRTSRSALGDIEHFFETESMDWVEWVAGYKLATGPPTPIEVDQCDMKTQDCSMKNIKSQYNTVVYPGGNTQCINSTSPFYFQVMPGNGKGVLIYFAGGGACWMNGTNVLGSCYGNSVMATTSPEIVQNPYQGVFKRGSTESPNKENPFYNYTIILISYCSGDVFGGNVTRVYDNMVKGEKPVKVRQAGQDNVMATLNWVKENIPEPDHIVVMGCSAGAIGAQLWGGFISDMYADAPTPPLMAVVADSYTGIFPATQAQVFEDYGVGNAPFTKVLSSSLRQKMKAGTIYFCELMDALHNNYPYVSYLSIQSKADIIQELFYDGVARSLGDGIGMMKKDAPQCAHDTMPYPVLSLAPLNFYWSVKGMYKSYENTNNFASYLVNSAYHCYTCFDRFYEVDIAYKSGWWLWDEDYIHLTSWLRQATRPKEGVLTHLRSICENEGHKVGGTFLEAIMYLFFVCP